MAMKDIRAQAQKSNAAKIGKVAGGDHKGAIRSKYGADPKGYLAGGLVRPQMPAAPSPAPMPMAQPMPAAGPRVMPAPMPAAPAPMPGMSAPMPGGMSPMLARAKGGKVMAGAGSGIGRRQNNSK